MLPCCLAWGYEVSVENSEYDSEDHEEEEDNPEEEKNSLNMILHLLFFEIVGVFVIYCRQYMCIMSNTQCHELLPRLKEQEQEELPMV